MIRFRPFVRRAVLPSFFLCCLAVGLTVAPLPARALLLVSDMVYVGEGAGSALLKIKNTGKRPAAYRVEWTQLRMNPKGGKETVARDEAIPGVRPAEPFMYVAPRRVILQPGQLQHIRFMVRRTQDMEPGEYRSYIVLDPEDIPAQYTEGAPRAAGQASAKLDILTGYRIPVFFLNGDTTLHVGVTDARLGKDARNQDMLFFTFRREGNRSAIGNLTMKCLADGAEKPVGKLDVRVFTEIDARAYSAGLNLPPGQCRAIALDYLPEKGDPDYAAGPQRLAEIPAR